MALPLAFIGTYQKGDEVATAPKSMASEPLDFASYLVLKRRSH